MQALKIFPTSINERFIDTAVEALSDGQIILYPTDTVYALGCDALSNRAIERLCAIKGVAPDKQLLSIVCADISQASEYARIDNRAFRLMKEWLPGPVTFVLPVSPRLPKVLKGRKTVGVRVPDNAIACALARALGHPILSASVDIDDADELASPDAIRMHYAHCADLMVDGGEGGTDHSTVVDLTDSASPVILRQGIAEVEV